MPNITITINTDNAAFDDGYDGSNEVMRILSNINSKLSCYDSLKRFAAINSNIRDVNGNKVGEFKYHD